MLLIHVRKVGGMQREYTDKYRRSIQCDCKSNDNVDLFIVEEDKTNQQRAEGAPEFLRRDGDDVAATSDEDNSTKKIEEEDSISEMSMNSMQKKRKVSVKPRKNDPKLRSNRASTKIELSALSLTHHSISTSIKSPLASPTASAVTLPVRVDSPTLSYSYSLTNSSYRDSTSQHTSDSLHSQSQSRLGSSAVSRSGAGLRHWRQPRKQERRPAAVLSNNSQASFGRNSQSLAAKRSDSNIGSINNTVGSTFQSRASSATLRDRVKIQGWSELGCGSDNWRYPFSLVQIHRIRVSDPNQGDSNHSRDNRNIKSYMRICGSSNNCATVKSIADSLAFVTAIKLSIRNVDDQSTESSLEQGCSLSWHTFISFQSMSLECTDIFLLYCRNVVIEYAAINLPASSLQMQFPPGCKPPNQNFGCLYLNMLEDDDSSAKPSTTASIIAPYSSISELTDRLDPQGSLMMNASDMKIIREISCVIAVEVSAPSQLQAIWYARVKTESDPRRMVVVVPLYLWIPISKTNFEKFHPDNLEQMIVEKNQKKKDPMNYTDKIVDDYYSNIAQTRATDKLLKKIGDMNFDEDSVNEIETELINLIEDNNKNGIHSNSNNNSSKKKKNTESHKVMTTDHTAGAYELEREYKSRSISNDVVTRRLSFDELDNDKKDKNASVSTVPHQIHEHVLHNMEQSMSSVHIKKETLQLLKKEVAGKVLSQKLNATSSNSSTKPSLMKQPSLPNNSGDSNASTISNKESPPSVATVASHAPTFSNAMKGSSSSDYDAATAANQRKGSFSSIASSNNGNNSSMFSIGVTASQATAVKSTGGNEKKQTNTKGRREVEPEKHLSTLKAFVDCQLKALKLSDDLCNQESIINQHIRARDTAKALANIALKTNATTTGKLSGAHSQKLPNSNRRVVLASPALSGTETFSSSSHDGLNAVLGMQYNRPSGVDLDRILSTKLANKRVEVLSALRLGAEIGMGKVPVTSNKSAPDAQTQRAPAPKLNSKSPQGPLPPLQNKLDMLSDILNSNINLT